MASTSSYWVHDLSPFLIRFPENPLGLDGIRYYGLAYLLSFAAAWALLRLYNARGKFAINADARATLMTATIIGVLAGGRFGYMLLYDLEAFLQNPFLVLRVDQGGMASHGGFVGVTLALLWFARQHKCSFLELGDVIVTLAPLGLCLGRIANFINGELWGRATTISWAVIFPDSPSTYNAALRLFSPEPRHPSQLYAAALEGALLFAYAQWRFWRTQPPAGQLGGEFLIAYGIVRIFGELFREPDAALILGLSRGQFYSTFMILAGAAIIHIARRKQPTSNAPTTGA
jgi:phosphatidylglycerol:prolipoprotein diacylglycerol transferase